MSKKKSIRYKRVPLSTLHNAVQNKETIDISNNDEIPANKIVIIKRNGSKEPFQPTKLDKVTLWATDNDEIMAKELINDSVIKLHKEIKIQDMYQQLIFLLVKYRHQ